MVKLITAAFSLAFMLGVTQPAAAQKRRQRAGTSAAKPQVRFLDAIQISFGGKKGERMETPSRTAPAPVIATKNEVADAEIEGASALKLKYAVLLNTEVEEIDNALLFAAVDEWFGTQYKLGGSTKDGVDCSAFVQAVYAKVFGTCMPRTAREQYQEATPVSRTELQQGDLVFFSTQGRGVSHVGIYLQNNKFAHAATSGGVMVSDLFEPYWIKHFSGVGRPQKVAVAATAALHP